MIGINLAKNSFQLHGARADGSVAFRKKLSRAKLLDFVAAQPRCTVAMEACGAVSDGSVVANCGNALPDTHPSPASRPSSDSSRRGACGGVATESVVAAGCGPGFRCRERSAPWRSGRDEFPCRRYQRGVFKGACTLGSGCSQLVSCFLIAVTTLEPSQEHCQVKGASKNAFRRSQSVRIGAT